jgi:hypothetical protein
LDPDFVILLLKIADWEWMNPHVKNLKETVCFRRKNEDIVGGIRIAIMQIYDQENGGNSGLRANWKGTK